MIQITSREAFVGNSFSFINNFRGKSWKKTDIINVTNEAWCGKRLHSLKRRCGTKIMMRRNRFH